MEPADHEPDSENERSAGEGELFDSTDGAGADRKRKKRGRPPGAANKEKTLESLCNYLLGAAKGGHKSGVQRHYQRAVRFEQLSSKLRAFLAESETVVAQEHACIAVLQNPVAKLPLSASSSADAAASATHFSPVASSAAVAAPAPAVVAAASSAPLIAAAPLSAASPESTAVVAMSTAAAASMQSPASETASLVNYYNSSLRDSLF